MIETVAKRLAKAKSAIEAGDTINAFVLLEDIATENLSAQARTIYERLLERAKSKAKGDRQHHPYSRNDSTNEIRSAICGSFFTYPDLTGNRVAEGGRRLSGRFKFSTPGQPLISIITVVYDNRHTIRACMQSVFAQTYPNIEYILVDGASTDGTVDIISEYRERIDYFLSEPDAGIYDAMNKGLSLARGDYIAFLNADDRYLSFAVSDSVNNIKQHQLQISYAGFYYENEKGVAVIADEAREWDDSMLIQGTPGGHETFFVHRNCYDIIGRYDPSFRLAADYDWIMRAYKAGFPAKAVDRNILVMGMGGTSFNEDLELQENYRLLEKNFGKLDEDLKFKLYKLKFYKNWFANNTTNDDMLALLERSASADNVYQRALYQTIRNRKRGTTGRIQPDRSKQPGKNSICIALTYLTGATGGAERIAIEAANELKQQGHAVTVIACHGAAGEPYYELDPSIPYIDLAIDPYKSEFHEAGADLQLDYADFAGRKFEGLDFEPTAQDFKNWCNSHHLWKARIYRGFFKSHSFDTVISHMPSTYPYTALGRPQDDTATHIASLHNAPSFKFFSDLYPAENDMDRYMRLVTLEHVDKIGVLFEQFVEQMPKKFREKCFVLRNFISPELMAKADKGGYSDKPLPSEKIILSVGRLDVQKDHATLIRSFAAIKHKYPEWELHIYGEGPLRDELEVLCREHSLDPSKVLRGTTRDITNVYAGASIFAFPSIFEGFGLTALEAMAFSCPVIAFDDCEGVRYLVSDRQNGLLASRSDPLRSFGNCLEILMSDEGVRKSLGSKGLETAKQFAVSQHIQSLGSVLADVDDTDSSPISFTDTRPITALTLQTYREGGAGIAAMRLHSGLRALGVDSVFMSFSESRDDAAFQAKLSNNAQNFHNLSHEVFTSPNVKHDASYFSSSLAGLTQEQVEFFKFYDVINLHWVENIVSLETLAAIGQLGVPMVWTLHDMKPFTGGCHYSQGCKRYMSMCRHCPQLVDSLSSFPSRVLAAKQSIIPDHLVVVTPSKWLAECAKSSAVFSNNRVEVISNGLDLEIFKPYPKNKAKRELGLPENKALLLFTCHDHAERRKGFVEFVKVVQLLSERRSDIHLVTLGHGSSELDSLALPFTALGYKSDPTELAQVYSAVDVTVLPTLEDNLPNIVLESAACGTPIVAFDSGGVSDAVIEGKTGYLVKSGDCVGLADKINGVLGTDLSGACREYAEENFSHLLQSQRYKSLFSELAQNKQKVTQLQRRNVDVEAMSRFLEEAAFPGRTARI